MTMRSENKVVTAERSPTVSVVIPAYNQAQFLAGAIQSVLAQTYQDYELIVVDDGSTDETPAVVMQFGAPGDGTNPIRYIWQSNQGLAGARNTGIGRARGQYIALLDSDDQWLPSFLQKMVAQAERHPEADVFYCPVRYMDVEARETPQQPDVRVLPSERLYAALLRANFLVPSTILMRTQAVKDAGLFDPIFRRLQDWELWLRMLRKGSRFIGLPERLVRYRLHGASLSTDPAGGRRAVLTMVQKLYGSEEGEIPAWPEDKRRAYGGAYRYHALSSVQYEGNWDAAAGYLERALQMDPELAQDLDMFYELALGAQPIGFRDTAHALDIQANAHNLTRCLEKVFCASIPISLARLYPETQATACYALGLVAYNHAQLRLSRRYFFSALRHRPALITDRRMLSILGKSLIGRSLMMRLRKARSFFLGGWRGTHKQGAVPSG